MKNGKANTLSCKANYFKEKKKVKHLILRINQDGVLSYNYMVLLIIFRVENKTFAEQLRTAIWNNKTTQVIMKKK